LSDYQAAEAVLKNTYQLALEAVEQNDTSIETALSAQQLAWLAILTTLPERRKGVLAVLITSLVKKIITPDQDVRRHQENMPGGYSGRVLDFNVVTPFLRNCGFPAMKESGWLTRSLEQNQPYDKNYPGKITPPPLKLDFLNILDDVQQNPSIAQTYLSCIFIKLEQFRRLQAASPVIKLPDDVARRLPISAIVDCLNQHFAARYGPGIAGASRLPVLALYSIYQCLVEELARFEGKKLLPLESHTSPDSKSGRVGDIDVVQFSDEVSKSFEAVEVKYGIPIDLTTVKLAYEKIKTTSTERYYVLSTVDIKAQERSAITAFVDEVKIQHGCEIIVNGITPSLKYYLRLLGDTRKFLTYYAENLQIDPAVKKEHREEWNRLLPTFLPQTPL
jgi:DNA (cytosine-5)-methyltransferase 1